MRNHCCFRRETARNVAGVKDEERTPRARAAWAYSGIEQRDLAERTGIAYSRLRELLRSGGRLTPTLDELYAIARETGVPRPFMDDGWAAVRNQGAGEFLTEREARALIQLEVAAAMRRRGDSGGGGRQEPGEQAG